jgi:hypothetical protein
LENESVKIFPDVEHVGPPLLDPPLELAPELPEPPASSPMEPPASSPLEPPASSPPPLLPPVPLLLALDV